MPDPVEDLIKELSAPAPAPAAGDPVQDLINEFSSEPTPRPGGKTMQQFQEDNLKKLEAAPPVPLSPAIQAIQTATANPLLSDKPLPWRNMASSILAEFQKAGIDTREALNDQFVDDAHRASDVKYVQIIQGAGLDKFNGGEESRKDKATIRAGAFAWELLDRMPLTANTAAPLIKDTLGALIDRRLVEIHDQIAATGPQGQGGHVGAADYEKLAAAAQQLKSSINEGNAVQVYQRAVLAAVRVPHNNWEAQALQAPRGDVVTNYTPGETYKGGTSLSIAGLWQPLALHPGESPTRKTTLADIDALMGQLFGPDAAKVVYNEIGRAKTAYFGSKLGLVQTEPGKVVPGEIVQGQNLLLFTPAGAMQRLMTRGLGSQPEIRQTLRQIESEQGKEAAAEHAKAISQNVIQAMISPMADRLVQPPELNQMNTGLTPVEEASMGKGLNAAIGHTKEFLDSVFNEGTALARDVDLALNRSDMFKAIVTRSMVGGAATSDVESIRRLQTLGEALTYAYRSGTIGRAIKTAVGKWDSLAAPPFMQMVDKDKEASRAERSRALGFGPNSSLGKDLAKAEDENAMAKVMEYFGSNGLRQADRDWVAQYEQKKLPQTPENAIRYRTLRSREGLWSSSHVAEDHANFLGDVVQGKVPISPRSLLDIGGSMIYLAGYGLTAGTAQIFASVADDPHTVAGLMAQGAVMGGVGKAVGFPISELSRSIIGSFRLKTQLSSIFRYHPEQVQRFLDIGRAQLDQAVKAGRPAEVLNDLVANLEVFTKNRNVEGIMKDSGEAARIVRTAWPEIQDGLGDLAHGMGEGLIPKSFVARIKETLGVVTPPDKVLVSLMGSSKGVDPVIGALADMTGARGDALTFRNTVDRFIEDNGREPTYEETKPMWPQSMVDLHGLMVSAERGGLKDPIMNRIWARMQRPLDRPLPPAHMIVDSAEDMMNRYIRATLALTDKTYSFGLPRQRSAVILDVGRSRLDNHIQTLEFETDLIRQKAMSAIPGSRDKAILDAQLRDWESQIYDHKRQRSILDKANDELMQHAADKPWKFTPEVNQILFGAREAGSFFERGLINHDTLGNILDLHPVLFDGRTSGSLWKQVRLPLSPERDMELQITSDLLYGRMVQARKGLSEALRTRISKDEQLLAWQARKASLEQIANKNLVQGERVPEIEQLQQQIDKRTQLLKDKTIEPAHVQVAESELKLAIRDHKEHQQLARRLREQQTLVREPDPAAFHDIIKMTEHDGLGELAKSYLEEAKDTLVLARVQKAVHALSNPFDASFAPATKKSQFLHDLVHSYAARNQAHVMKVEELVQEYNKFSQADKDTLSEIQRTGGWIPDRFRGYVERERQAFKEFWDLMRVTGRTPEHVMKAFERFDLNPQISGAVARPQLVRSPLPRRQAQIPEGMGTNPIISSLGADWTEMMFKRDLEKFRVRVQEESRIVDKTFDSQKEVDAWMDQTYGQDAWKRIEKEKEGKRRGQTIYGEPITIGRPMTDRELEVMDFAQGVTGEARLDALKRGLLDAQTHMLVNAFNGFGDMVMDAKKFDELRTTELAGQYHLVPDDPSIFGVLAGKHIHIDVLREVETSAKFFKNVEGLLAGWKDAFEAISPPRTPKEALLKLPTQGNKISRWFTDAVKGNVILKSLKTWMVNWTFNMISDHLAGTHVMSQEGMGEYFRNMVRGQPSAWEPYIHEGREMGILGGFWDEDSTIFNDVRVKMFGIDPKQRDAVAALLARRRELYAQLKAEGASPGHLATVELDINATQLALEEANRNWVKNLVRWGWDTLASRKTILGQSRNRAWAATRRFYNHIDENFKMGQYVELRQRGLTPEGAASIVRMFSQDYANIPGWVRGQGGPFRSLVTSFPYEASRIISNAALYKPMRFISLMGAVPFLNLLSFSSAGMNWDRAMAMLDNRGKKGQVAGILGLLNTIYLTDPSKGEITSEIQVSNVMPFANLAQTRGVLPRAFDKMSDPERRGFLESLMGLGIGYASNYVGNNPLLNFGTTTLAGVDSMTGEQLADKEMGVMDRIKLAISQLAQDTLPPAGFVWGRDSVAWERSTEAPLSPKTGRLFKADEKVTDYIRQLFGITVRGGAAGALSPALLGEEQRSKAPLVSENDLVMSTTYQVMNQMPGAKQDDSTIARYGEYNEQRRLIMRSVDNTLTPAEREKAKAQSVAMYKKQHQVEIEGLAVEGGTTDRQYRKLVQRIVNDGPADWFALQRVDVQAATLALLDKQQLSDAKMRELITAMELSEMGKFKNPRDEGLIKVGIRALTEQIAQPGHNKRLEALRDYLTVKAMQARNADLREQAIEPGRQAIKEGIRGAR